MTDENTFIARQPIFDRRLSVFGYELLSRSGPENVFNNANPDQASIQLVEASLNVYQLDSLVRDTKAFVNVTRNLITEDFLRLLPPEQTVIELLETIEPDDEVIAACKGLKKAGYLLALDDFVPRPELEPLVPFADIIKVDFMLTQGDDRRALLERYARRGLRFLAEKIETHEDKREALDAGYSFFQGYFFCKPEMLSRKDLPRRKAPYLRLLQEVNRPELDLDAIEKIVREDVSLSVKLLRYLNSIHFGMRSKMTSIRQALIHLGERPLRRWGAVEGICGLGEDKPNELILTSLVRARFCELLGDHACGTAGGSPFFLTGLLSTLEALLDRPLEAALSEIAVDPDVEAALSGDDGLLGRTYALVLAYERGDWQRARELEHAMFDDPAKRAALPDLHRQAVVWSEESLRLDKNAAA